jgi:hypothetical protein
VKAVIHFVESHWGDLVALLVLCAGIGLVVFGPHEKAQHLGEALSAAALVGLKLRATNAGNSRSSRTESSRDANPAATPEN